MTVYTCCVCGARTVDPEDYADVLGLPAHPECAPDPED